MSPRRTRGSSPSSRPSSQPSSRPPSRPGLKGRHWVAIWLGSFLLVALLVIRRQSGALQTAQELQALQKARGALEVSKSALLGEVHRARSRTVLVPLAEQRLGLRLPQDPEITILQNPRPR